MWGQSQQCIDKYVKPAGAETHTKKVKKALARVVIWNWNLFFSVFRLLLHDFFYVRSPRKKVAFVLFLTYDSPVTLGLSSLIF